MVAPWEAQMLHYQMLACPLDYIVCPLTLHAIDYMDGFEVEM